MTTPEQWDSWAATWTVLGRLLAVAPDAESIDQVRSAEMLAEWPMPGGQRTAEGIALLEQSREQAETVEAIAEDQFLLMRGPGKAKAVPWESVYLSREGLVFDAETLQVREFYRRFGLQAPRLNREPDDHISLELEFCATLLVKALDAVEADEDPTAFVEAHAEFCNDHLFRWAPEFFSRVEAGADTAFYRGIGVLGADSLAQVAAALDAANQQ